MLQECDWSSEVFFALMQDPDCETRLEPGTMDLISCFTGGNHTIPTQSPNNVFMRKILCQSSLHTFTSRSCDTPTFFASFATAKLAGLLRKFLGSDHPELLDRHSFIIQVLRHILTSRTPATEHLVHNTNLPEMTYGLENSNRSLLQ